MGRSKYKTGESPYEVRDMGHGTPCWIWIRALFSTGYGLTTVDGKAALAHRVFYRAHTDEIIPKGMHLDHLCRVRSCVNPLHLELVTPRENKRRGLQGILKKDCVNGHPLSGENLWIDPHTGLKECLTCRRRHAKLGRMRRIERAISMGLVRGTKEFSSFTYGSDTTQRRHAKLAELSRKEGK